jgi:hypothetical protein
LLGDINRAELNGIRMFIDRNQYNQFATTLGMNVGLINENLDLGVYAKGKIVDLKKLSSKTLREILASHVPICTFKFGSIITPRECINWGAALRKVISTRHKSILLRVAHGDVYTKSKLYRFRLNDSPNCSNCGEYEDLQHKLFSCPYTKAIWDIALELTDSIKPVNTPANDPIENRVLGQSACINPLILTIHAEIMQRILAIRDDVDYRLRPRHLIKLAISFVSKREIKTEVAEICANLLNRLRN